MEPDYEQLVDENEYLHDKIDAQDEIITGLKLMNEALENCVKQAAEWLAGISSGDGSGHADMAAALYRMANMQPPEQEWEL